MASAKKVHTLVLDTGAIIKNDPPASTLLQQAEEIVTIPSIVAEIKDASTRNRFETTLRPFITLTNPNPASIKFVTDFARKTGDLAVLSRPDIELIALTYQLECRRNGGDWRLRNSPGQKDTNGRPPKAESIDNVSGENGDDSAQKDVPASKESTDATQLPNVQDLTLNQTAEVPAATLEPSVMDPETKQQKEAVEHTETQPEKADSDSDSDGGWITPQNLKQKQRLDNEASAEKSTADPAAMQVAIITSDFAMQNVILQINLTLLSPSLYRIRQLKTHVLRCHACFQVCRDPSKQFCPRCGQATLKRVACSTNERGEFRLHLKNNVQWNHRGDRYSVPKPVHGAAHGRMKGGGKGGWGNELMLAEDQKEYQSAMREQARRRERGLMDEDYLPGILTGERGKSNSKITVGAGRNVNSKKR